MKASRYAAVALSAVALVAASLGAWHGYNAWWWALPPLLLLLRGLYDMGQSRHSVLRAYPLLGHLRFLFESIRPEIRQYLVEGDTDAQPFSRLQRSVVYQRAKNETDTLAFGSKQNVQAQGHEWVGHSMAPTRLETHDFRVSIGTGRAQPYALSLFNVSAMSFGALSANAIRALNRGAKLGGFAHDTGEGSLSSHHRENGGDIIWQIASGYFGCRQADGRFDPVQFAARAGEAQVKMIEIKLSQGAKPGHGGMLPASKVTHEIAVARGIVQGQDCISPAAHGEFSTPLELLEFVDRLRDLAGGKPVGIKLCVGHPWDFFGIVKAMLATGSVPDFIVVDGAEGGTGAAPLEFADHVGTPLQEGLLLVHNALVGAGLRPRIKLGASGKIVSAFDIARALALGADWVNSARGFMFAIGCIQAQSCNTGRCPTGIATQDPHRQRALVVADKATRVFNYHANTLEAFKELLQAAGLHSPADLQPHHIVRRVSSSEVKRLSELLDFLEPGDLLRGHYRLPVFAAYWERARMDAFALQAESQKLPSRGVPVC